MGTRSRIGIVNSDGTVTSIYCQYDGYIEHHGPILLKHYATEEKIRALLELGSLSSLGESLGEKHDMNGPFKSGWCRSYSRDRGEIDCDAVTTSLAELDSQEYNYLFRNGKWTVQYGDSNVFIDLRIAAVVQKLET